jgi:hypothetical protein
MNNEFSLDTRPLVGKLKGIRPLKVRLVNNASVVPKAPGTWVRNLVFHRPLKGSGSRYVHGGASLQEVVIPVI